MRHRGPPAVPAGGRDRRPEIAATGLFAGPVERLTYPWSRRLDAPTYLRLLDTYSGHRQLTAEQRRCLHTGIADLLEARFDREHLEERNAVLYLGRRR